MNSAVSSMVNFLWRCDLTMGADDGHYRQSGRYLWEPDTSSGITDSLRKYKRTILVAIPLFGQSAFRTPEFYFSLLSKTVDTLHNL